MANNNSYIFNEQAQWTINWTNKVFTVANTISTVESLRIGYVEYTSFTFSWNTITLTDAPSTISGWVFVDYFYDSTAAIFDSVNLIYDEILSWDVDWINTIFYSVYPIDKIDELRIDWIVYNNFTFNWRIVTLAVAPTITVGSPHIDYYRKDVELATIDSWVTLSQLRSSIYTRLGQQITSLQFPKELADEYISEWVTRISKMKRDRAKRWIFSFHKSYDWFIKWNTWNSIDVGTTSKYLPAKGIAIVGNWDVVYYSLKTTSTISSISWLETDTLNWVKIQYGYKLSKNIEKISEVFIDWFKLTPSDFAEYRHTKDTDKYCVYNWYLFLPYSTIDWSVITCVYLARNTSEYDDSSIIDFDWDYLPVVKSFVLWNMYKDREDDRFNNEYSNYKQILKEYKRELGKQYETTSAVFQTAWPLNRW